jgi:hypothetical protein
LASQIDLICVLQLISAEGLLPDQIGGSARVSQEQGDHGK